MTAIDIIFLTILVFIIYKLLDNRLAQINRTISDFATMAGDMYDDLADRKEHDND